MYLLIWGSEICNNNETLLRDKSLIKTWFIEKGHYNL